MSEPLPHDAHPYLHLKARRIDAIDAEIVKLTEERRRLVEFLDEEKKSGRAETARQNAARQ